MNEAELEELEQGIRDLLAELDLDWVLADIDEGIKAKSRVEVVLPRRAAAEQAPLFEDSPRAYLMPVPGYKGPTVVGDVPVDPDDRVDLIIDALRRLVVELPSLHDDAVKRLADSPDRDSVADDIVFLPDEDDSARAVPGIETIMASAGRRREAEEFLARLRDEAMG